ncbi:MAG TPA: DUF2846 domain-containing protein [Pyrinomonadaceae bacterium]|nr:DUF2846 domain-containing protein [Pyrinomonadaceae bacterium]
MFPHIKQSLFTILIIASLSAHLHAAVYINHSQDEIVVTEGTPINVTIVKEVTSKEAKPNDPVDFTVAEDLVINGQVIVRKGTPATGSVINAEKGGYMGKSGKLAVQVESTTTSDGRRLKLRAAKGREGDDKTTSTIALSMISPAFLFRKGSEAKIAPGTVVTVYVAEEKRFRLEGATLVPVVMETTAASSEEATVFIYRPDKWTGRALEPSVFVDETELARMDNGRFFAIKLKPGKHIIRMTDDKKGYAFDMGPGQTYFFRIGIEAGMWKGHGKITLDDRERAVKEIKKLKFIGQDKIKAPALVVELAPQ